ncbi:SRPBCC family protein [Corynebacterium testudinoris]|uniref:Polyketide cyclase / dehydrase and lipid transport n=1 Tax=Corynebacterium testudinoris TaxID=136857 RepID=A0A0G3H9K6_9CORY|nr:SRPBCC family protein [Corynebacterium testudinoris]AKK10004.1 Polyketide cyclase / dehydrase and lipid transport [Corynebacterium testudinoris]MBX8995120.1 SRPBCC family protein [Corynebacterium testudinoris]
MLLAAHNSPQPDVALFRTLVAEHTGLVISMLNSFGVDPESLIFAASDTDTTNTRSQEYRRFVPATPDEVWSLLSDPDRWLEWNSVEFKRCERADFGVIRAYPPLRLTAPDHHLRVDC